MKKFMLQIGLFSVMVLAPLYALFTQANGYADPFYLRFTSPRQQNLLLGTSKAAQGLQPSVFMEILETDFYNYSFTIAQSPYGPTYLESIRKKLDPTTTNGIFVLNIDVYNISSNDFDPNDDKNFGEEQLALGTTQLINLNPNPIYLINHVSRRGRILKPTQDYMFLHDDGWLELAIPVDSTASVQRVAAKVAELKRKSPEFVFSNSRMEYLIKTIEFLKGHGSVYLVRLPVHPNIMEVERDYMPDFDAKIKAAVQHSDGYLDLTSRNAEFFYNDGIHLHRASGKEVSGIVARWIKDRISP